MEPLVRALGWWHPYMVWKPFIWMICGAHGFVVCGLDVWSLGCLPLMSTRCISSFDSHEIIRDGHTWWMICGAHVGDCLGDGHTCFFMSCWCTWLEPLAWWWLGAMMMMIGLVDVLEFMHVDPWLSYWWNLDVDALGWLVEPMEPLQFMAAHMSLLIWSLMANEPMEPIYMATMMVLYWWIPLMFVVPCC